MKYIVGIDPGFTETGVVLYTDDDPMLRWATFKCPAKGQASAPRAASLAENVIAELVQWVEEYDIAHLDVCIEMPFFNGKNVASYQKQMRVVQEIESGLLFRLSGEVVELWVTEITATQVKLLACNYGQATKVQIISMSPFAAYDEDGNDPAHIGSQATLEAVADAWAIGQAAWGVKGNRFNFKSVKAAKVARTSDKD